MGYRPARKTIDRDLLVSTANKILGSPVSTKDGREAIQYLIEHVLIEGNSYKGFDNMIKDRSNPDFNNRVRYGQKGYYWIELFYRRQHDLPLWS